MQMQTEQAFFAFDVVMMQAKRMYTLMIETNSYFFFKRSSKKTSWYFIQFVVLVEFPQSGWFSSCEHKLN